MRGSRFLILFLLLGACETPTGVLPFPSSAIRVEPPSIFREWWAVTEQCSGRQAPFDAVTWYVVPNADTLPIGDESLFGVWYSAGNRIVLAGHIATFGDEVRHEMLHAILGTEGAKHPREFFVAKCGGVVTCYDPCLADAGPAPPPAADAVPEPPTVLSVTVTVTPPAPSSAMWDGFFMMTVKARNRASFPIVVQLAPSGDAGPPASFSYDISRAGGGGGVSYDMRAEVPEVTRFAPGETKQFIFDLHNVAGPLRYDLAPGTWTFKGAYGDVWAASPPTVVVGP